MVVPRKVLSSRLRPSLRLEGKFYTCPSNKAILDIDSHQANLPPRRGYNMMVPPRSPGYRFMRSARRNWVLSLDWRLSRTSGILLREMCSGWTSRSACEFTGNATDAIQPSVPTMSVPVATTNVAKTVLDTPSSATRRRSRPTEKEERPSFGGTKKMLPSFQATTTRRSSF